MLAGIGGVLVIKRVWGRRRLEAEVGGRGG